MDPDRLTWAGVGLTWLLAAVLLRRSRSTATLSFFVGLAWLAPAALGAAVLWHRGPLIHLLVGAGAWWPRSRVAQVVVIGGYALSAFPVVWPTVQVAVVGVAGIIIATAAEWSDRPVSPACRGSWQVATTLTALAFVVPPVLAWTRPGAQWSAPVLLAYSITLAVVGLLVVATLRPQSGPWATDLAVDLGSEPATDLWDELVPRLGDPALGRVEVEEATRASSRLRMLLDHRQAELQRTVTETRASWQRLASSDDAARLRLATQIESLTAERLTHVITELEGVTMTATGGTARSAHRAGMHLARAREELDYLGHGLVHSALADGLHPALRRLATTSTVPVDLDASAHLLAEVPQRTASTAYFVVAEAVTNAVKHARAHRIGITAVWREGRLELRVVDDGVGGAVAVGAGLAGVRERVSESGGTLDITSPPHGGTEVHIVLPVGRGNAS